VSIKVNPQPFDGSVSIYKIGRGTYLGRITLDVIQLLDWVGKIRFGGRNTLTGKVGELFDAVTEH
jgi:hypothetical protein